jgi:hypothetical protein
MKILKKMLFYYSLGIALSLVWIGFIHLYSYIAEPYFSYAEWNNILLIALISGAPFGVGIAAINHLKTTK